MKKKKYILTILVICTLTFASSLIAHVTRIMASRSFQPLSGIRVVLDPGHGGMDDGAYSNGVKEDEINLKIAMKLKKLLNDAGAEVVLTRDGDFDLAEEKAKNRKREDMKKRVELINDKKTDIFLSIHLNAYPNTSVKGAQAFYEKDNEVSNVFADIIQKHFKRLTNTKMTSKAGDYYILNNAKKIGALVECGFLSNYEDKQKLITDAYQDEVAKSLYESIAEYFDMIS